MKWQFRSCARWTSTAFGAAGAIYAGYAATTWWRYGYANPPSDAEQDPLLDRFMPLYDVAERHHVRIHAPAEVTLAAASEMNLLELPVARALFRARALILGAKPDTTRRPTGLLPLVESIGWGVLAEIPGREIVVGSITKPWEANVTFRALPPGVFAAFRDPGFAKIVWTLRADPLGANDSVFRTETRVATTDETSRARFRRYWSLLSPGILLTRRISLGPLKREAERRAASCVECLSSS